MPSSGSISSFMLCISSVQTVASRQEAVSLPSLDLRYPLIFFKSSLAAIFRLDCMFIFKSSTLFCKSRASLLSMGKAHRSKDSGSLLTRVPDPDAISLADAEM